MTTNRIISLESCYTTAKKLCGILFIDHMTWTPIPITVIGFVFRVEYKLWTCHYSNFVLHVNQFQVTWLNCDSVVSVDCWIVLPCAMPSITRDLRQRRFWATAANQKWTFMHYWKAVLPKRLGKLALWEWPHLAIGNRPLRGFQDKLLCLVVFPLYPSFAEKCLCRSRG